MLQQAALAAAATERRRSQRKGNVPHTSTGVLCGAKGNRITKAFFLGGRALVQPLNSR